MQSFERCLLGAASAVAMVGAMATPAAAEVSRYPFHIEAGPLDQALLQVSRVSGQQIIFSKALLHDRASPRLEGVYSLDEAIDLLLRDTGLTHDRTRGGVVMIKRATPVARAVAAPRAPARAAATQTVAAAEPVEPAAEPPAIEEVVVTARRLSENVQKTPLSITAMSAARLDALNVTRVQELSKFTPNLTISDAPSNGMGTIVYLRGIGQIAVTSYSDPPVSIYVDGVVQARPVGNAFDLPDIDHVEVLRGPQGTLFGRNTTGGAISIYTRRPADTFGGSIKLEYGNYNEVNTALVLNTGPIGDTQWLAKATLQHHSYDGWVRTAGRSRSDWSGYSSSTAGSFVLAGPLSERVSLDNRLDYSELEARPAYQLVLADATAVAFYGQSPGLGGPPLLVSSKPLDRTYLDPRTRYDPRAKSWGDTLTLTYDAGPGLQIKSITGYRELEQRQSGQIGGSALVAPVQDPVTLAISTQYVSPLNTPGNANSQHQFSQEFQAQGRIGQFSYATGLYYFSEASDESLEVVVTSILPGNIGSNSNILWSYNVKSESYAAYGQIGYKPAALDDRLELSLGVRYTWDKRSEETSEFFNAFPIGSQTGSKSWDNVGWSASASYQWAPSVMTYARASSAYRAGGFDPLNVGAPSYDPETATVIEAGIKSDWLGGRVQANASVFKTFYKNLQILQRNAALNTNYTTNAAEATYTGVEFESIAVLGGGFQLNTAIGYIDPQYQHYYFVDALGARTDIASVARFPFVSRWTVSVGAQYKASTRAGDLTLRADYSYQSSHFFAPVDALSPNNAKLGSGEDRDLRVTASLANMNWGPSWARNLRLRLYGENLLNERYRLSAVDSVDTASASFNRPRTYGIGLSVEF